MPAAPRKPRAATARRTGEGESIALVLAGGGARGAYEAGALSALAPLLEKEGRRPTIYIGTSVGALNSAFLAARAHEKFSAVVEAAVEMWREMHWRDAIKPLISISELDRVLRALAIAANVPGASLDGLLDPSPLRKTLEKEVDFDQLERNVEEGKLAAAAVVATSYATTNSIVFHSRLPGRGPLPTDPVQGIEYFATRLAAEHVLASAAIPAVFPPAEVTEPQPAAGWYGDGGVRLNAPLKPAVTLGAERVVVIGLNSSKSPEKTVTPDKPEVIDGVAQILQVVLADQLTEDVNMLATVNRLLRPTKPARQAKTGTPPRAAPGPAGKRHRHIPYIFIKPADRLEIGRLARKIYARYYACSGGYRRDSSVAVLGSRLKAERSDVHAELLSYLFLAPEFLKELVALGRKDAEDWLKAEHDEGIWQHKKL